MTMPVRRWCLGLASVLMYASGGAMADQHQTCTMDDHQHKAQYNCPDGYDVVYSGEGTKECDGACYRKGNKESLGQAVRELLQRRKVSVTDQEISRLTEALFADAKKATFGGIELRR